jgi:hypothetical protein
MEHNKTGMEETVTREEMVSFVKSRGWYSIWNEDNWNSPETDNLDWGGDVPSTILGSNQNLMFGLNK